MNRDNDAGNDADAETDAEAGADPVVRAGGEHAARDAVALMLGLAATLDGQVAASAQVHPDLYRSLVERLRRAGAELATVHGLEDLLDPDAAPAEGTAWAQQLTALLRETPRERHDAPHRGGDRLVATSSGTSPSTPDHPDHPDHLDHLDHLDHPEHVTELLDRSGEESFPASDPPSV